ncbi:MAG TPA: sialidase family protein [Pirellulales bacterium]|nr:sialidase family protein [Pirellulales bacterium]
MPSTRPTALYLCVVLGLGGSAVPALGQGKTNNLTDQPGLVMREFVYETAPFPECHASSIAETHGTLVATWFGGTEERNPDVGIWVSRLEDGKWTAPVEVANGVQQPDESGRPVRYPTWNPVLFQLKAGPLLLFYKVGPSPNTWWGMLTTSADRGQTWSPPRRLPDGVLGPIKNKPIELPGGELLCPSSTESVAKPSKWQIHFERTSDLGKSWEQTGPLNDGIEFGAIQPSLLRLAGDRLLAVGRTRQGTVFQIQSDDGGRTWGKMKPSSLPNPNSGIDAVTLRDGRHLIVYNHTRIGRSPLNVAISADGADWKAALVLEDGPGEYSYPAVIQSADGLVHITYTWQRKRIRRVVVDPDKLVLSALK